MQFTLNLPLRTRNIAYRISYTIYFRNIEGSTLAIAVYIAHQMVKESKDFDLSELLWSELVENITLTKNTRYPLQFGSLIMCLIFYFTKSLPLKENVVWKSNVSIGKKIYKYLECLEERRSSMQESFHETSEFVML